jgi:hypothetical protein
MDFLSRNTSKTISPFRAERRPFPVATSQAQGTSESKPSGLGPFSSKGRGTRTLENKVLRVRPARYSRLDY